MKSFTQFIIAEALTPEQDSYIRYYSGLDDPDTRPVDYSDHIFSPDAKHGGTVVDRDTAVWHFPDEARKGLTPEIDVQDFLTRSGYDIVDYTKGLATRKGGKGRPIGIGRILNTPIQPPDEPAGVYHLWDNHRIAEIIRKSAKIQYDTSDVREAMKTPMQIMITRDPYKVAQMSSGPRWSSCLTLGTCPEYERFGPQEGDPEGYDPTKEKGFRRSGTNLHKLLDQIKGGAHVAYLIGQGDYDLKNPFARITLRPYHDKKIEAGHTGKSWSEIRPESTILIPSVKTYTSNNLYKDAKPLLSTFRSAVTTLIKGMVPRQSGKTYHVDPLMYNEAGDKTTISPEDESDYYDLEGRLDVGIRNRRNNN